MSTLSESDIAEITRQADVLSKPLRDNFTNLKNAINDNQTQLTAIVTPASGSEVVNARDNLASLQANIRARRGFGDRVISETDFIVTEQGTPDDTVQVAAGTGVIAGIGVTSAASQNSGSISASSAGKHRIVTVAIQSDNTVTVVEGAEYDSFADAVFPSLSSTQMPLAWIDIDDTTPVVINDADINDGRAFLVDPFNDFDYYDENYIYDTNGLFESATLEDKKGNSFVVTLGYSGDKVISSTVTIGSYTYTETYTYSGDVIVSSTLTMT